MTTIYLARIDKYSMYYPSQLLLKNYVPQKVLKRPHYSSSSA